MKPLNKKGQVVDFFAGIQRGISWFLQSAPKPLLLLLFLLFLVGFSALFTVFLNSTGNFCDTAGNEYKTGTFEVVNNFQLISTMPKEEDLNSEQLDADEYTKGTIQECSFLYEQEEWLYTEKGEKVYKNLTTSYYFQDDGCIECTHSVWAIPQGFLGGYKSRTGICLDQVVYPNDYEQRSFWEKRSCGETLGRCAIPEGYYYDATTDTFICDDELCKNEEGSTNTVGELWNLKLKEKGAKLRPESPYGEKDYRNALAIECDAGDLNPKFRFFGIEIFNYKIWLLLILLSAIVWTAFKIKRH